MTEQFLNSSDIVAVFQHVRGEAVSEHVRRDVFGAIDLSAGCSNGVLDNGLVRVVAVLHAGGAVREVAGCGEDVLPAPFAICVGIFAGERMRQGSAPQPASEIGVMLFANAGEVVQERLLAHLRQHGCATHFPRSVGYSK